MPTPHVPALDPSTRCPCGTGDVLGDCCGPILTQERRAATAEQLMRSRYTAFALHHVDHTLRSWHPRTSPSWKELDSRDAQDIRWLRLEVLQTQAGGPFDSEGVVEFKAFCRTPEGRRVLHERSRFLRENGQWLYLDGKAVTD